MSIDVTAENLLSLKAAAGLKELERDGRAPHISAMYRWSGEGVRGVKLEVIRVGATLCTTREAVLRFIDRLNEVPAAEAPATRSPARRAKGIKAAESVLVQAGI